MNKTLKYIAGITIILACLAITKSKSSSDIAKSEGLNLYESLDSISDRVSVAPNIPSSVAHTVSSPVHPIFKVEISN